MADQIGSEQFVYVAGAIDEPGKTLIDRTEVGEDGAVYEEEAVRAEETELECAGNYSTVSAAKTALTNLKALIGTVVSITQQGSATSQVTVLDAKPDKAGRKILGAACGGLGSGRLVWAKFSVKVRKCRPS
jgi:hypothetical protein